MESGVSAQAWVPGEASRCAFCHEKLGRRPPEKECPRCHAPYHRDCWKANDSRCAVYGCEPVPAGAPAPAVPVRLRAPAVQPAPTRRGWPWWLLIWLSVSVLSRLGRCTMESSPSIPRSIRPMPTSDEGSPLQNAARREMQLQEARALMEESRSLLEEVKDGASLPEGREDRRKLLERVEADIEQLVRARQILIQMRVRPAGPQDRGLGEVTASLDRLMRVRTELYRILGDSE